MTTTVVMLKIMIHLLYYVQYRYLLYYYYVYTGFLKEHVFFVPFIKLREKTQVAHLDIPWVSLKKP